jgi:uncharacterized membrane protein
MPGTQATVGQRTWPDFRTVTHALTARVAVDAAVAALTEVGG